MDLNTYQQEALKTALPQCRNLLYMTVGASSEAGELLGKMKKIMRGDKNEAEMRIDLAYEAGDVLWYLAGVAEMLGMSLDDIAMLNISKLQSRRDAGTLQGDGDAR